MMPGGSEYYCGAIRWTNRGCELGHGKGRRAMNGVSVGRAFVDCQNP